MTGLLARLVYFNDTPVGRIPTQIDYSDYRDVSGVRMPFKWTTTWTDGRMIFEIELGGGECPGRRAQVRQARPAGIAGSEWEAP